MLEETSKYNRNKNKFINEFVNEKFDMDETCLICEYHGSSEVIEHCPGDYPFKWKGKNVPYIWYALALQEIYNKRFPPVKSIKVKFKPWSYFTLAPSKFGNLNSQTPGGLSTEKDKEDLKWWAESWFVLQNYDKYVYALESGKGKDGVPFYHIHALTQGIKNRLRKQGHYSTLQESWNHTGMPKLITKGKYPAKGDFDIYYQDINCEDLLIMKMNYLNNDLKGSHKNFEESLGGAAGAPGVS